MKNILVLFVSPVHDEGGKVNSSSYKGLYQNDLTKGKEPTQTTQTNESAIIYLSDRVGKLDRIFAFVSQEVKQGTLKTRPELSHYEYFKSIAKQYVKDEKNIIICEYDAHRKVNESIDDISQMAKLIMREKDALHDDITLHADMTGGLRNASMMMLGLMRFLEYSGMKIGKVMYSNWERGRDVNWVEEANEVYGFFDLVAGAKEFNNFGSVKEISKYYKDNDLEIGTTLKKLLHAMEKFSEEIKLCHTGELVKATDDLAKSIKTFESDEDNNNKNIKIFKAMLSAVKTKYKKIIEASKEDKLSLIEWCVENDYVQQALTLYTELMPKMFFDKGLIRVSKDTEKEIDNDYKLYKGDSSKLQLEFYLVGIRSERTLKENLDENKQNKQTVSDYFANLVRFIFSNERQGLEKLDEKIKAFPEIIIEEKWNDIARKIRGLALYIDDNEDNINASENTVINNIAKNNKKLINCTKLKLCKAMSNKESIVAKDMFNFFDVKVEDITCIKENTMSDNVIAMYRNKILESSLEENQIRKLIDYYSAIKNERNGVNHARLKGDVMSLGEIKKMLEDAIGQFKECCKGVETGIYDGKEN